MITGYQKIRQEIIKIPKWNETENTTYQNLWDTAKAEPQEKLLTMNICI
jgi:hypothetical protein